jgi:glycosyltransferase involved in cell wall biosynthesis
MQDYSILILMATYNGEKYIKAQLDSILNQSYANLTLLIRDDNSIDNTIDIIKSYALLDSRIQLIEDGLGTLGPCQNFAQLMKVALKNNAPYIMFSDQDDVWFANKIAVSLKEIHSAETRLGVSCPILIHTDLEVVDEQLKSLSPSYWLYQHLDPEISNKLNRVLVQNVVTGCTMIINKSLLKLGANVPSGAIMHDWWLNLIASAFGKVIPINQSTLYYRQHCNNQIGAQKSGLVFCLSRIKNYHNIKKSIVKTQTQAISFMNNFSDQLSPQARNIVNCYAELNKKSYVVRCYYIYKNRYLKNSFVKNIGFFLFI